MIIRLLSCIVHFLPNLNQFLHDCRSPVAYSSILLTKNAFSCILMRDVMRPVLKQALD